MHVSGRTILDAPRADVFDAICDPRALLEIIPGCREIRLVSPTEYRGRIALRLPAIAGGYDTFVRLVETDRPGYGAFEGRVEGRIGSIAGTAAFRLAEADGGTEIAYEGQGVVTGPLARLDSRFVEGLAASLIDEGVRRLAARLAKRVPPSAPAVGLHK